MKVQITLKSGVQVDFAADEITRTTDRLSGEFTGLKWKWDGGAPSEPHLFYLALDEVAAIVTMGSSTEAETEGATS